MPNQYENDANFMAHYESTGPEIWKQMAGNLTHFFTGCGTGGTITGTSTYLKEQDNNIKVIAVQAQKNHLLQGLRNFEESAMPELFTRRQHVVDSWFTATNDESFRMAKELASRENLLVGPSSGAVMASMLDTAKSIDHGVLVGIFADDGRKFKSLYAEQHVFNQTEYERLIRINEYLPETACPYSYN
jgi:cysteine synthase B